MTVDFQVFDKNGQLIVSGASRLTRILSVIPVTSPGSGSATFAGSVNNAVACSTNEIDTSESLRVWLTAPNTVNWEWVLYRPGGVGSPAPGLRGFVSVIGFR